MGEIKNSVFIMLHLSCILVFQMEMLGKQLNKSVWSSGKRLRLEIEVDALKTTEHHKVTQKISIHGELKGSREPKGIPVFQSG